MRNRLKEHPDPLCFVLSSFVPSEQNHAGFVCIFGKDGPRKLSVAHEALGAPPKRDVVLSMLCASQHYLSGGVWCVPTRGLFLMCEQRFLCTEFSNFPEICV